MSWSNKLSNVIDYVASVASTAYKLSMAAAETIDWSGRSKISSPADGQVALTNAAGNDFSRLMFGGTTNAFPALKRSSDSLQVRKADDSSFANITANTLLANEFYNQYGYLVEAKLATVNNLDTNSAAKQNVYTVPAGKTLIVTRLILRNASAGLAGGTTCSFGFDAGAIDVLPAAALGLSATNMANQRIVTGGNVIGAATNVLGLKMDVTEAGKTFSCDVYGIFV